MHEQSEDAPIDPNRFRRMRAFDSLPPEVREAFRNEPSGCVDVQAVKAVIGGQWSNAQIAQGIIASGQQAVRTFYMLDDISPKRRPR
jgi:hypothetical protein